MTSSAPALTCRGLTKSFGDVPAISEVDLDIARGEVVALIGLNGAGKTTLMRLALAMTRPDHGSVSVLGTAASGAGTAQWRHVGHLIETPFAYPELTVSENLWAAARLHGVSRSAAPEAVAWILDRLELGDLADRRCGRLSQGNRQRVGLGSAWIHHPKLLILDEPTNALDPSAVVLLRDLVQESASEGAGVLVSSHHLDEVARVAHRVEVIHRGRMLGQLPPRGPDLEHAFFQKVHTADLAKAST